MKMDDRDSAECQNWRKKGQNLHFSNCLNGTKDKSRIVLVFFKTKSKKKRGIQGKMPNANGDFFREMMSSFSLEIRVIRSSAVFGTRRRTALRGEGFAWVPDL